MKQYFFCVLFLFVSGFGIAQNTLRKVTCFISQRQPVQFAGMICAKERGMYAKYGLDVTFVEGERNYAASLMTEKKVDFTVLMLPTAIKLAGDGLPLLNIAQLIQTSSLMYVAKKTNRIYAPSDLAGRKTGTFGGEQRILSDAFLKKLNLKIQPVIQGTSVNLFLEDGIELFLTRYYDDYHTLHNSGIDTAELSVFPFRELGLDFPEDGIYCLKKTYQSDSALCRKFVAATLEGWQEVMRDHHTSVECISRYLSRTNNPVNESHVKWFLGAIKAYVLGKSSTSPPGVLDEQQYHFTAETLQSLGLIKNVPPFQTFSVPVKR